MAQEELRNDRMAVDRWKKAVKASCNMEHYRRERGLTEACSDFFVDGVQWADEHPKDSWWRSVTELPKDGEPILMKLSNGKYQYSEWVDDGKGFNEGFVKLNFGGGAMMRLPVQYEVVAWRPLADVINEFRDYGIVSKQSSDVSSDDTLFDQLLNIKVEYLPLSVRTVNMMKAAGLETLLDVVRLNKRDFLYLRNAGKKSLDEVSEYLEYCGLQFGMKI